MCSLCWRIAAWLPWLTANWNVDEMKTRKKFITSIGIFAIIGLSAAAIWYFWVRPAGTLGAAWNALINPTEMVPPGTLKASGTVETTVHSIGPEVAGKI